MHMRVKAALRDDNQKYKHFNNKEYIKDILLLDFKRFLMLPRYRYEK